MFSMTKDFQKIPPKFAISVPISPNSCTQMFGMVEMFTKCATILSKLVQYFYEERVYKWLIIRGKEQTSASNNLINLTFSAGLSLAPFIVEMNLA